MTASMTPPPVTAEASTLSVMTEAVMGAPTEEEETPVMGVPTEEEEMEEAEEEAMEEEEEAEMGTNRRRSGTTPKWCTAELGRLPGRRCA